MPYKIEPRGDKFAVINEETGDVKAEHSTEEDAKRQVRLLTAIEKDPNWEAKNG